MYKYNNFMSIDLLSSVKLITTIFGHSGKFSSCHKPQNIKLVDLELCSEEQYKNFIDTHLIGKRGPQNILPIQQPCDISFLQSPFWGRFKSRQGWRAHYICGSLQVPCANTHATPKAKDTQQIKNGYEPYAFALLVLSRSLLPFRRRAFLSLAYIPFGPLFSPLQNAPLRTDGKSLAAHYKDFGDTFGGRASEYLAACRQIIQALPGYIPLSCFFVRMDSNYLLHWYQSLKAQEESSQTANSTPHGRELEITHAAREFGFQKSVQRVQVPDTVLLDLQLSEDELLAQMHKKHRYNIRLAIKKGVNVCQVPWQEGLCDWYKLYQVTAERDRIGIHKQAYYQDLFAQLEQDTAKDDRIQLHLYLAYGPPTNPALLGGIIVLHDRDSGVATYLYGASANEGRQLMPNYLLQWQAIRQARSAGLRCYDFFGIPPHSDPQNSMHGLYRFKIGFGGYIIRRAGAWDLAYSWVFYKLYRLLERGRLWLQHR